jgi:hypothetical protein
MKTQKKMLFIGRHGQAPQKPEGGSEDYLMEGEPNRLYHAVGVKQFRPQLEEADMTNPARVFLRHTNKNRTKTTGQSILVGAYDMQANNGYSLQDEADLANYSGLEEIDTAQDDRLNIGRPHNVNMAVYKRDGAVANVNFALQNPNAIWHEGERIESGYSLINRGKAIAHDAAKMLSDHQADAYDAGTIVTHATVAEFPILAFVNSGKGRSPNVDDIEAIGGSVGMAEFAELHFEKTSGGVYNAELRFRGDTHKVNLDELTRR